MPADCDLYYIDKNDTKVRPVIIHRAIYGSYERFITVFLNGFCSKLIFTIKICEGSPSTLTAYGRKILKEHPDTPGTLGIGISEAVEYALDNDYRYMV